MRGDKEMRQIALRVSIALAAGMFSIVPVVHGAPVGGVVKHGDVTIGKYDTDTKSLNIKDNAEGTNHNNVIDWQDFSVAKGETVYFDGSTAESVVKNNNYMNIVSGKNTSDINGAIVGGKDVYIINPNGVIFGEGASVNVGSLYASTRYVSTDAAVSAATAGDMTSVLGNTSASVATDIVNMGSISADKVVMEGQNIRLLNSADISAASTNVILKSGSDGYIHVGNSGGTNAGYTGKTMSGDAHAPVYYTLVDGSNWSTKIKGNLSGNYMLAADINAKTSTDFAPITGTFSGKIDGMYHAITNMEASQGVFASLSGGRIDNFGVVDSTITSPSEDDPVGAIANMATGTVFSNVYNKNTTITGGDDYLNGGLVGGADGITLTECFNTGATHGSGLIGYGVDDGSTITIKESFSTGTLDGTNAVGLIGYSGAAVKISDSYAIAKSLHGDLAHTPASDNSVKRVLLINGDSSYAYNDSGALKTDLTSDFNYKDSYKGTSSAEWSDSDITNTGGVTINTTTGDVTRPTWRIYEGVKTPVLTSFLKGIKTTSYKFGYFTDAGKADTDAKKYNNGANNGADMPYYTALDTETDLPNGLLYNAENLKIVNSDGTAAASDSTTKALSDAKVAFTTTGYSTVDTSHVFYDSAGQKHATYTKAVLEEDGETIKNPAKQNQLAFLYSDENGYDLVGNNISIAPRVISLDTTGIESKYVVKEYDGTPDVTDDAVKSIFSGDSTTTSGILPADYDDVGFSFSGDAEYQKGGVTDSSVGVDKTVSINGTVSLVYDGSDYILAGGVTSAPISGTASGVITQKVIPISLKSVAATKTYDANAVAKGVLEDGTLINGGAVKNSDFSSIDDFIVTVEGSAEDVELAYADKAYFVKASTLDADTSSDAGAYVNKVRFGGLKLTGETAGNYILVDDDDRSKVLYSENGLITKGDTGWTQAETGINVESGGALFATGQIYRRDLSSHGFSWYKEDEKKAAVREYNGKTSFEKDADGIVIAGKNVSNKDAVLGEDYEGTIVKALSDDDLTFTVISADFITSKSEASASTTKNVAEAQGVRYKVEISGDSAGNYKMDGVDIKAGDEIYVIGAGEITPRTLNFVYNKADGARVEKQYDSDNVVKRDGEDALDITATTIDRDTDFLVYADPTDAEAEHHILEDDTTAKIHITGVYKTTAGEADAYVNYTAGAVADKNLVYTAEVMDGDAYSKNYKFAVVDSSITLLNDAGTKASFTINVDSEGKGMGAITQREIGKLTFAPVSKTYDGDAKVTNTAVDGTFKTDDVITINGAFLSDGTTNALVGSDTLETVFNDVGSGDSALITGQYGEGTTLDSWEANANAGDKDVKYTLSEGLLKNNNYKMDATEVIDAGNGEIEKLTIKESEVKVKRNSTSITKVYNGNENVAHDDVTAESYLDSVYVDKDTSSGTFAIDFTVTGATYDDKHSHDSAEQGVTYTLSLTDTTNIKVTKDDGITDLGGVVTKAKDYTGADIKGIITPRGIVVSEDDIVGSVTKIYDGGKTVKIGEAAASGEDLVSGINAQILSGDAVSNSTDAVYSNKNVNAIDPELDADTGLKKVTYNLKLSGDTYSDYKFVDADGHDIGEDDTKDKLYKGNGTITERSITVSTTALDASSGWPTKTYGTYDADWEDEATRVASVKSSSIDTSKISFGTDEDNAIVADDIDLSKLKGLYGVGSTDATFVINGDVNTSGKDVQYSGVLTALGDNAGNYTVADTFYGKGYISPLELTRDRIKISIGEATKTYDNTYTVKKDGVDTTKDNNYITTFQVMTADGAWEDFGYTYDDVYYKGKTVSAEKVVYKLGLGDIETNYVIADVLYEEDLVNGYINSATGQWWQEIAGTITPATVYASLKDEPGTATVVKPYDASDEVTTAGVADKVQVRGLDFGDGTDFAVSNIRYEDANVGRDADGKVAAKNVYYDVALTAGDAGDFTNNYVLVADEEVEPDVVYTSTGDIKGTLTGQGMITPLSITASFAPREKPYDPDPETTATVRDTDKVITFSGATGAGAIELDSTALHKIIGTYGTHDSTKDAFTADGHVYRPSADTDEVGTKPVLYENIAAAYHDYIARNMDSAARNYEVADEPAFYGTEHGDKITPLSLDTVKAQWTGVDKTYDATPDVKDPKGVLKLVATSSTSDATKELEYTLGSANYTNTSGELVSVVGNHTLSYVLTKVPTNQGDYQLSADAASAALTNKWLSTEAENNVDGTSVQGKINRRVLTVDTEGAYFRKIYDGSPSIDDSEAKKQIKLAFSDEDAKVWAKDTGNVDYSVTANFVGADASAMPGEILNGKDVKYTLTLDGTSSNNYTLTTETTSADTTPVHSTGEVTLVESGDIEKRELKVKLKDGYDSVAARNYNGSDVVDGFGGTSWFEFEDADVTTGVVGSEAVNMKESVKAAYAHDGDVNRGNYSGKGKVEDAIVNFTNFKLDDSPANKNYYISTETLQGSGRINPLTITVDVKDAPTKEYDGKTDVGTDNWTMASDDYPDYSNVIDADKDNVKAFIQSAEFKNPNASTGDKAYTYNLAMENGNNYQLVLADDSKHTAESTDDGLTLAVSGKDGTIKPRRLTASVIREMTKEYDGDTSGTKNAEANISFGDRVVSGDNIGLTAQATYDNPFAGISEGSSELRKHDVIYTLNLSNPNYELAVDTVTGPGTIYRKGLNIVATPASVNTGETMPEFTGTVEGLIPRELGLASSFKFETLPTTSTSVIGSYPVYGWYSNRTSGNFGLNYTFDQDVSNATAFTVTPSSIINDNPDSKITPNGDIYNQISKDLNSGFGDNGAAAIEYVDKSGNVIARENIDSGEIHGSGFDGGAAVTELGKDEKALATIGIVGGDIVNLDGADAASTANIELDGNGSIVNLEVFSINGERQKADGNSGAEIVSTDSEGNPTMEIQNTGSVSNATIQLVDESGNVLEENNEDKAETKKKEGEIAIESSNNQNDDEIELKVEDEGVNVA